MQIGRFTARRNTQTEFQMHVMAMMGMMTPSSPDNVQPGSVMLYQKSQSQRNATVRERISGHEALRERKPMTVLMTK